MYFCNSLLLLLLLIFDIVNICEAVNASREKRYLVFPTESNWAATKLQLIMGLGLPMDTDVSTIIGYVIKFNYILPMNASLLTDPYIRYERSIDDTQNQSIKNNNNNNSDVYEFGSRWEMYRMIELSFNLGKDCLLKVICEVASVPFKTSHGIFSELLHVLFTPSTTQENYLDPTNQEYHAAEVIGKNNPQNCKKIFHECEENVLDYFTEITFD